MKARAAAALCLLVAARGAAAFGDPTRPPGAVEPGAEGAAAPAPLRLESVLIAPDRRVAIINGAQVVEGGTYAGATVVRITENAVQLRGRDGLETLKLLPDVKAAPRAAERKMK